MSSTFAKLHEALGWLLNALAWDYSFKYHAQVPDDEFDTVCLCPISVPARLLNIYLTWPQEKGRSISESLSETFNRWNLSSVLGHAPQDYFLSRYPVTDDRSLLKKLMDNVLPATVYDDEVLKGGRKRIYLANSGCQRFDIVSAPFRSWHRRTRFLSAGTTSLCSSRARSLSTTSTRFPPSQARSCRSLYLRGSSGS